MHTPLNEQAFAGAFRAGDSRRFDLDLKTDRTKILVAATAAGKSGFLKYGPIHTTVSKGRKCSSIKDYSQTLILRILTKFIARRFRIDTSHRERLVRGVIESLSDSTPMFIVRRDISSFYESIPTQALITKLTQSIFIPTILRQHLDCFFRTFCPTPSTGVPRGICVSPILAELAMESFDKSVKNLPGVYKYFRYSDDILIFSYLPTTEIEAKLPQMLPPGMQFNKKKSACITLNCSIKEKQATEAIEYLGYSYKVSNLCGDKDPRKVEVCISNRKISRLKTRIFRSFRAYEKDANFSLLHERIQFLAGNYIVHRHGATTIKSSKFVKSGIFYNYKLCGVYEKGEFKGHNAHELKALDGMYQSLIKPTTKIGSSLTSTQYSQLRKISFFKGFQLKITTRFSPDKVVHIKKAWRND